MDDHRFKVYLSVATLANAVTGFSIAQNLVVIVSIFDGSTFSDMININFRFWLIGTLVFLVAYLLGLWFLFSRECDLLQHKDDLLLKNSSKMFFARCATVLFVYFLVILTGFGAPY